MKSGVFLLFGFVFVASAFAAEAPLEYRVADTVAEGTRLRWDIPIAGDFSASDGFAFDFKCSDLAKLDRNFTLFVYCRPQGVYATRFGLEKDDGWSHVVVHKRDVYNTERHPDGWANVSKLQITVHLLKPGNFTAQVKDFRPLAKAETAAAILYLEKDEANDRMMSKAALQVQSTISLGFDAMGADSYLLSDHDLARGVPANAKLVFAEGREKLTPAMTEALDRFLGGGGRIVCWRCVGGVFAKVSRRHPGKVVLQRELMDRHSNTVELLRPIALEMMPERAEVFKAKEKERAARAERQLAAIAAMPPKAEDHRSITCHNPWGKPGLTNWMENAENLRRGGFTHLSLCLCRGIYASYESKVLRKWPRYAENGGDALEAAKAACAHAGLKLTAWRCCWMTPDWLVTKVDRAELEAAGRVAVDHTGQLAPAFQCPTHPDNVRDEVEALVELAHKGVEGIDLDYIRYNGPQYCFCSRCRGLFERRLGRRVANWPADARPGGVDEKRWIDFRVEVISEVVRQVSERVRRECPGVAVRVYGFKNPAKARETVGQDWPYWGRKGWIDAVSMMDYCSTAADFRGLILEQRQLDVGKAVLHPVIGTTCWRDTGEDAWKTAEQISIARECGYSGWGMFDFGPRTERIRDALAKGPLRIEN